MELESFRLIYESKMTKTSLLPSDWKCDTGSGHFHPPTLKTTRGEWDPDEIVYSLLFILKSGPKWPPDCISVSTSGQRCRKWWCQLRPIRLLLCREGAGLRAICNSCWQRLPPTVLLHSSTWYSCINRPFTGSPTTGRDNALPCSTHTSCQVSCLTNRKTPVMFNTVTDARASDSASLLDHLRFFLWLQISWHFLCRRKNQQNSVRTRTNCLTGYAHLPTCYEALSSLTMENTPKQGSYMSGRVGVRPKTDVTNFILRMLKAQMLPVRLKKNCGDKTVIHKQGFWRRGWQNTAPLFLNREIWSRSEWVCVCLWQWGQIIKKKTVTHVWLRNVRNLKCG